jgi:ribonuclease R
MPYQIGVSNSIIEEFMLVTNKVVAKTFRDLEAPFIYRIHETPDLEKLRELNEMLKNMGSSIKGINKIHPRALATALETFADDEKKYMIVSKMLLRSLKLAKYSEECLGHFGLNFKDYCHFTSPIRRYPDLFIHRVISKYLENGYVLDDRTLEKLQYKAEKYALSSSECEKTATQIERDFDDLFMAKYMKKHLGDEYEGVISSVTGFGIYVKLDNTIEGLVTMSNLDDDYYIYHEKEMVLIGERTGKKYEIGQKVKVIVARADEHTKQIDFCLSRG